MEETPPVKTPSAQSSATPAVMDVVAPPPTAKGPAQIPPDAPAKHDAKAKSAPQAPKVAKPPKQGVTAAITATVIIVLGLGVLAVIAYLKSR